MEQVRLKDLIKGKTTSEIINSLPTHVCIEDKDADTGFESLKVLGVNKDSIVFGYTDRWTDDEGWRCSSHEYRIVKLKDITKKYIVASAATKKQIDYISKNECYTSHGLDELTGYEAWHIIDSAIRRKNYARKNRYNNYYYEEDDCLEEFF